jgi:hypothetical protein
MKYNIIIGKDYYEYIDKYFNTEPFVMQAAFALTEVTKQPDICTIQINEFIKLHENDYEYHTSNSMSIYSRVLLNILHKISNQDKLSLVYFHSHQSVDTSKFENKDHEMIFRISYAYLPFGIHASVFFVNNEISGKIWMPSLSTIPLNIIYHE